MNTNPQHEEFLRAYDDLSEALFRHCYFRVFNREQAKDLVQEVFTKTWEYIASGKRIDNMRAFLYRSANNIVIDHIRKKKSLSLDELHESGFDPRAEGAHEIDSLVEGRALLKMLGKLEESYRQVIVMRFVDDLSPRDIAAALGESENAVSVRLHRALKKAREVVSQEERKTKRVVI